MIWKNVAVDHLKHYAARKLSLDNLRSEILQHQLTRCSIHSANTERVPVRGDSAGKDAIINSFVFEEELKMNLRLVESQVVAIEGALCILSPEEQLLLDRFFIHPEAKAADRLAGDLHMDVKTVYRRKDEALRKFTIALYGMAES